MTITRKDYRLLASILKDTRPTENAGIDRPAYDLGRIDGRFAQWQHTVHAVVSALSTVYPNFNAETFWKAVMA